MSKLHHSLQLQHRKHTGKLLHHRHTSYRGLSVVLGLAAVVIVGLNVMARATADSLYVYARIAAPIPATAPVITYPREGTVGSADITVRGTCPVITPRVVIVLLVDGVEQGSVACDANNTFAIPIVITPGPHTLIARPYTVTGDTGPDSAPVHILYIVPSSVSAGPGGGTSQPGGTTTPLVLTIDEPFIVFGPGKDAVWLGSISGGSRPYYVHIDWGDGNSSDYTVTAGGQQHFQHHYKAMHPYDITFTVTDSGKRQVTKHFAAVTPYVAPVSGGLYGSSGAPWSGSWPMGIYGAYLLLLALFGWLWTRSRPFAYAKVPRGRPAFNRRYNRYYSALRPKPRSHSR